MLTEELDYDLPPELIAQEPVEPRDSARLLVDRGPAEPPGDLTVADLPDLLERGDVVVVNETRVIPSRVAIRRAGGGGGEVLFLRPVPGPVAGTWEALCRPSRKLSEGDVVDSVAGGMQISMVEEIGGGRWLVVASCGGAVLEGADMLAGLEESGSMPLPPYISHDLVDPERYQTVFAKRPASAAAPTAGLHFTTAVLEGIAAAGATVHGVELVVGLDTFRPLTTERVEDHEIHSEFYVVPDETWMAVRSAREEGRRVVAVGTTSVRALESVATTGELTGETRLFITPGYRFQVVDVMMTNFHLPRTTLLAMVEAFVGPRWRDLYRTAIERRYRFLSFGDAMWLERVEVAR